MTEETLREKNIRERKESALRLLGPLGFVDNEDDECTGEIFHAGASLVLDTATLKAGDLVGAILAAGRERGREDVRRDMRKTLGL